MDERIPSVILQSAIDSLYSGAAIYNSDNDYTIEGVNGTGDEFMLGNSQSINLPDFIISRVKDICKTFSTELNSPVKIEWGYTKDTIWIFQLHKKDKAELNSKWIVKGEPKYWYDFNVNDGLEKLRELISRINSNEEGVKIHGYIGITSHVGDLLRNNKIISKMV